MTWYPTSYLPTQYVDLNGDPYSGSVLKCYSAGTTTPILMATTSAGATTATSFALNASGYPVSSGNVIIPHVQENFKAVLYPDQASADANSGATWSYDQIGIASVTPDGSITAAKLASDSVTTVKILDGNVTAAKLSDNFIHDLTIVIPAVNDYVPLADTSDSNKKKKGLAQYFGRIIDSTYVEYATSTSITSVIPSDNTIPQVSEGVEILSGTITPKKTTNRLRITVSGFVGCAASNIEANLALFVNGAADAVQACSANYGNAATQCLTMQYEYVPGALTVQTISVRLGTSNASFAVYGNSKSSTRQFGGAAKLTLVIDELSSN